MIFSIIYAKSILKDIKNIPDIDKNKIKKDIEELKLFPNVKNQETYISFFSRFPFKNRYVSCIV